MDAELLHPNMEVKIYIEWPKGILDLGIITKEFLEEYSILLGNRMYGNVDAAILWLILLANYLVSTCNLKSSKLDYYIEITKDVKEKLELVMQFHVDDTLMAGKPEKLKYIK